jgi:hypothetical protein
MLKVSKKTNKHILIILPYFNRPNMVRNALYSILLSDYQDWTLAINDYNSTLPIQPVVREILNKNFSFYQNESINDIIKDNNSDICILLCDDDALYPNYLHNLSDFFCKNTGITSCYSNTITYNPMKETLYTAMRNYKVDYQLQSYTEPICANFLDCSQIAWLSQCDFSFNRLFSFEELCHKYGPSYYSGFISQYKGIHDKQLSKTDVRWVKSNDIDTKVFPKKLINDKSSW